MTRTTFFVGFVVVVLGSAFTGTVALCAGTPLRGNPAEEASRPRGLLRKPAAGVLFDFGRGFDVVSVITNDAKVTLSEGGALRIQTGDSKPWPGITLKAPAEKWDLSKYEYVSIDVKNIGTEPVTVYCRVDNPGADCSKTAPTSTKVMSVEHCGIRI